MLYAVIGVAVLLIDQFLKFYTVNNVELNTGIRELIPGVIHISHIKNFGALFGVMKDAAWLRWAALLLMLVFAAAMILALIKGWLRSGLAKCGGMLLLAGILGNGIDRAIYGYVVDMLEFEFVNFALFNLADALILIGGILFCIAAICGGIGRAETPEYEEEEPLPARRRAVEEEEIPARPARRPAAEEAPVRPARRPAAEEAPVRRSVEPTAAPRVRRVIDESTVPVPDRTAQKAPAQVRRTVKSVEDEEIPVRTARSVRPVENEEAPVRVSRPVRPAVSAEVPAARPVRPAVSAEVPAARPVRPAVSAEVPAARPVRPAVSAEVPAARPVRPAVSSEAPVRPVKAAAPVESKPAPAEDDFDLDSILAEFK